MTLNIRKFPAINIKPDTIILLVGKRGTGKSTLLIDLCYQLRRKVDYVIGMSPTEDTNSALGAFIPKSAIYDDYDEEAIIRMMNLQRQMWRAGRGYSAMLVLDDCCYDKKILRSKVIREIFMNGRHRHLTFIISAQYVMDLPPDLRTQVDYVFALRENVMQNRERMWKQFFGFFKSYKDFATTMDSCTENFECMVCDNKSAKGNTIEDSVYWYKASRDIPKFKMGKKFMWKLHTKYFRETTYELPKIKLGTFKSKKKKDKSNAITQVVKQDESGHNL